jgi:CTP:molybdopterin cytidylyltransferase MocA
MGGPKQTLPFRGSTIVGSVVRTLLNAGLEGVVVVTRSELLAELGLPVDTRVCVATNDDPASQMIDSVRIGLSTWFDGAVVPVATGVDQPKPVNRATDDLGVLVVPADMPGLSPATCQLCVRTFHGEPTKIIIATYAGRRGHPLIFPATLRADVFRLPGGLNTLAQRYPDRVLLVDTGDLGAVQDVDTWEHYRSLTSRPLQ